MTSCETKTLSLFVVLVSLARLVQKREVSKLIMWLARSEDDGQCLWLWLAKCSICKHLISSSCVFSQAFLFQCLWQSLHIYYRLEQVGRVSDHNLPERIALNLQYTFSFQHCLVLDFQALPRNLPPANQASFQSRTGRHGEQPCPLH